MSEHPLNAQQKLAKYWTPRLGELPNGGNPGRYGELFSVKLVGRISLHPHQRRYLGDGTRIVAVEKVLIVSKAE